jgi:hypothetical protein
MTEHRFNGLFESLEARLAASVAAEERLAAEDLALSLQQDRTARDVLLRSGWTVRRPDRGAERVLAVGHDYVQTDSGSLIPIPTTIASETVAPTPAPLDTSLLERLRDWARSGAKVQVEVDSGTYHGLLLAAGRDHLVIASQGVRYMIPLAGVTWISRRYGSSTDVP